MSVFHHHKPIEVTTHYKGQRFIVTEPVRGGYAYWNVADTQGEGGGLFTLETIWKGVADAPGRAHELAQALNSGMITVKY